jgi:lipopolysaccharide cholinephosphotransferase
MKSIQNGSNTYHYDPNRFKPSYEVINKLEALRLLEDCRETLHKNGVKMILCMGTLLGAIRDQDFIDWDYDIDVAFLEKSKIQVIDCIPDLKEKGINVCRYDGKLLSFERNGTYIDFYFFVKHYFFWYKNTTGITTKKKYFDDTQEYNFLGSDFLVPFDYEGYLRHHYGDWKIPRKDVNITSRNNYVMFRSFIKSNFPVIGRILSAMKRFLKK